MEETTRVLIVDDFQPFRAWVLSLFRERPTLIAVGEASDGAQAIEKAKELRPDLILLDIGLPKLHGIEVARRVREFSPSSRILFLSQETSREVIEEAMATGAGGYVCKSKAGGELLPAIDAVLIGKQFVSAGRVPSEHTDNGRLGEQG